MCFAASQRTFRSEKIPTRAITYLSHEQESTISCLSRARQRSYYANSINSFAVSDTRIKGIDAVGRVWNTLSTSPSNTRKYLRGVLLVADTSPITLRPYTADCITLRGTLREAQWNKSPRYPFDFIRAQFPSSSIRSASRSSKSRSEWIFLFSRFPILSATSSILRRFGATDFWSLDTRRGKRWRRRAFSSHPPVTFARRPTLLNFNASMRNPSGSLYTRLDFRLFVTCLLIVDFLLSSAKAQRGLTARGS